MKQHIARLIPFLLAPLLAACAGSMNADVTRFHSPDLQTGRTIAVVAMDEKKADSLEFRQYAAQLMARLREQGFSPAQGEPDLIASFDYFMRPIAGYDDNDSAVSIGVGGGSRGASVGVGIGTSFGGGSSQDALYVASLTIEKVGEPGRLFEGRAVAEGRARDFTERVPLLINALFENFPGQNGKTVSVDIPIE
ncbi:MAG: DUF4136 domain-containing protein [Alphaproteobacteria bacterium]|nr:DUF4136 domain-containing protein [Alphaproteobacteria bacterium]